MATKAQAAGKFMRELSGKAELLHKARKAIDAIKARHERELEAHFAKISKLKAEVLTGLKVVGLSSVKLRSGDAYYKTTSTTFEIKNPIAFDSWARQNRFVRIDREMSKRKLQTLAQKNDLPEWAIAKPVETIGFRNKPKKKK